MKGTREHDLTERQDIRTGPVSEKSKGPGSGACWAETVGSRSRKEIFGLIQNIQTGRETGSKIVLSKF